MESNMPSTIRLMGVDIPITMSTESSLIPEVGGEEVYGFWDSNNMEITVSNVCGHTQERVTVLHELVHAIDDFLFLDLSHQAVYAFSQALFQVLRDNPGLSAYLSASEPTVAYSREDPAMPTVTTATQNPRTHGRVSGYGGGRGL